MAALHSLYCPNNVNTNNRNLLPPDTERQRVFSRCYIRHFSITQCNTMEGRRRRRRPLSPQWERRLLWQHNIFSSLLQVCSDAAEVTSQSSLATTIVLVVSALLSGKSAEKSRVADANTLQFANKSEPRPIIPTLNRG